MNKTKFNRQLNETSNTQRNYRKNKTYVRCAVLEKSYENVANLQLMEIINAININNKSTLLMATTAFVRRFFFFSSSDLISWNTRSSLPFSWHTTILVQRQIAIALNALFELVYEICFYWTVYIYCQCMEYNELHRRHSANDKCRFYLSRLKTFSHIICIMDLLFINLCLLNSTQLFY